MKDSTNCIKGFSISRLGIPSALYLSYEERIVYLVSEHDLYSESVYTNGLMKNINTLVRVL